MLELPQITLIEKRRDAILAWLDAEAPYTACDQRHLDAHTPEQAYWNYGYQAALDDILRIALATSDKESSNADTSNPSPSDGSDASDSRAG